MRAPVAEVLQAMPALEPDLADLVPPELALSAGVDADLTELEAEFAPPGKPDAATPDPWTSDESQSTTPDEPAAEPSKTPEA
jgi:hypothetical protein